VTTTAAHRQRRFLLSLLTLLTLVGAILVSPAGITRQIDELLADGFGRD